MHVQSVSFKQSSPLASERAGNLHSSHFAALLGSVESAAPHPDPMSRGASLDRFFIAFFWLHADQSFDDLAIVEQKHGRYRVNVEAT